MPKKDVDFSEADFKKEVNKILKSMDIPLDPDGNYPDEVKELWPAIQSKLGKKLLAKNWRVWTTMWTNVIGPTYVSAAKEAAKYAGVKYRGEIGSFAKKYHRDHGLALCKTLTETDLQRVQDQIVDNWGIGEKAFEKQFQDDYIGSEARLKTIYRSEHARAISEGTLEVGQEVGHQYKQWWCAEDERSCEICMAHHEETVPMDEAFSGGFAIPQDSHPSCRCVLITLDESDLSDDQKSKMAARDPISLDDLDPTFRNSPWKSNEAFRQVLNYKCPENSHGPGFSCGGEETLEDEHVPEKQNSILKTSVQSAFEAALKLGINKIKFNANCPESEKVGSGPGSCGGKTLENPLYSSLSKKSQATMKKYKMKGELKKAKTSIMASLVKSTKYPKTSLENAKINASIFKGMTAEEADELTGDAAQEHTNWLMDKGAYYDIKQGIFEPMLEDTEELYRRGWNVNGTYHPDIPKKSILDDAAAKIFTYKDEQGRFRKNAELIDAIEEYTGDLYDMYNKVSAGNLPQEFLNLTPEDQKDLKDRIDNFAAALNSAKLPEPVVTYRGIRETTLKRLEQLGATEVGSEFQVNYFQSTTLNYETTKSFLGKDSKGRNLRIQIKLPKGAPAAYVDGFSANNGEDEVLVNRNLKYRCVDVKENDATKTLVWEAII